MSALLSAITDKSTIHSVRCAIMRGGTSKAVIFAAADLPENPQPWRDLVAVSLYLRPGHSGGPLVDMHGRLVGISTIMAGPEVGLAVPVDAVRQFLNDRLQRTIARAA